MDRALLVLAAIFGFIGVALGAFGSHALRARLTPERLAQFETGVRYQLWHALALFGVVLVARVRFATWTTGEALKSLTAYYGRISGAAAIAGWLFVVGTTLFSGSLYGLAFTGARRWAVVTPIGGVCLVLGWLALAAAAIDL